MGKTRAASQTKGVTLDAGALIALEKGDRRMIALLRLAVSMRQSFYVPAGVIGQVWQLGSRRATLARFLKAPEVQVEPLDDQLARACGELCGATGTSDVVDASVVLVARARGSVIVTSDPGDLRRLDPQARLEAI